VLGVERPEGQPMPLQAICPEGDPLLVEMTDLFCGAGGSSTGAVQIPGVKVRIAARSQQAEAVDA